MAEAATPHRAATNTSHRAATTASHRTPISGPYAGLRAFQKEQAAIFFGRDEQIDGLMERLEHERLVVIAGESGCGKSSLVRAGLLPALDAGFLHGGGRQWKVADLKPGDKPIFHLADALVEALRPDRGKDAAVVDALRPDPSNDAELLAARLRRGPRGICDLLNDCPLPRGSEMLILVDQFEELIRFRERIDPDEADAFVALLLETVADQQAPVRVVLTLRSDYLGGCTIFPGLAEVLNGSQYLVPRLERDQLRETIINPARVFDGDVDPQLANELINKISQSQDQLPVLEHALQAMWSQPFNRRRTTDFDQGSTAAPVHLKLDDFRALGGLGEALSRHADAVYNSLEGDENKRIARRLFCALWDEGATGRDTRRSCRLHEAAEIVGVAIDQLKAVVEAFRKPEHSFLMPAPETPLTETTMVDVSHESLFRHWTRLKDWIRVEAEGAEHYRRLLGLARARQQKKGDLLSGRTLRLAIDWWESQQPNAAWAHKYSGTPAGRQAREGRSQDFALVERFLRDSWRAKSIRRWLSWGLAITAVVVGYTVTVLMYQSSVERKTDLLHQQVYRQQISAAFNALRSDPVRAMQLALEAQGDISNPEADAALHSALRGSHFRSIVFSSLGPFRDARFLPPDGRRILTTGEADGLAVWETATGSRLYALHRAIPARLAVNSKGTRAATSSDDGTVDLWDLSDRKLLWTQRYQVLPITDIAFSPDDSMLATTSEDGSAVLWSVQDGKVKSRLIDHLGVVTGLAFSHDSNRIATAGADGRIVLWDARSGQKLELFAELTDVDKLAFDATGRFLAATSGNSLTLWDPVTRRVEGSLRHPSKVTALAFSPDGRRIATTSLDGTLRVWDASSRTERFWTSSDVPLHDDSRSTGEQSVSDGGEPSWPRTVEFSADGRELVTTGLDGRAKIWDVEAGGEALTFRAHEQAIRRIAVSPTDDQIATGSDDGTAAVWDTAGHPLFSKTTSGAVLAMGYNATGKHLAVADGERVDVWTRDGHPDGSLMAGAPVRDLQWYHGQEDRIAIAAGRHVEIWSMSGDHPIAKLDAGTEIQAVAVSPADDRYIASECRDPEAADDANHPICLWDAHTFNKLKVLRPHARPTRGGGQLQAAKQSGRGRSILSLCFSGNGTWLASSSNDKTITIWEIGDPTGNPEPALGGHRESVTGLAISPDGKLLVSSSDDRIRLWNATSYVPQDGFPDAEPGSGSVAFYRDGKTFVAGGNDGIVRVYQIDNMSLRSLAQARMPIPLTDSECKQDTSTGCRSRPTPSQLTNKIRYLLQRDLPMTSVENTAMVSSIDQRTFGAERTRFANARTIREAIEIITTALETANGHASRASRDGVDLEPLVTALTSAMKSARARSETTLTQVRRDSDVILAPDEFTKRIEGLVLTRIAQDDAESGNTALATEVLELTPIHEGEGRWAEHAAADMASAAAIRSVRESLAREEYKKAVLGLDTLRSAAERHIDRAAVLQRFIATTLDRSGDYAQAARLARSLSTMEEDDVGVLADQAEILLHAGYTDGALTVLKRVLKIDPTNDRALWIQGRAQSRLGHFEDAATSWRRVSPLSPFYKDAAALAGVISYDKLARPTEGFRSMVLAVDPQDTNSWAMLAQVAWAAGRFSEALLMVGRVLEARAVKPPSPEVELAMRFVRVAALCQSRDYEHAETELRALIDMTPSVIARTWDYEGDQAVVKRIKDAHVQRFIQALLAYTRDGDSPGDSQRLFQLLHEARDAWAGTRASSSGPGR